LIEVESRTVFQRGVQRGFPSLPRLRDLPGPGNGHGDSFVEPAGQGSGATAEHVVQHPVHQFVLDRVVEIFRVAGETFGPDHDFLPRVDRNSPSRGARSGGPGEVFIARSQVYVVGPVGLVSKVFYYILHHCLGAFFYRLGGARMPAARLHGDSPGWHAGFIVRVTPVKYGLFSAFSTLYQ